MNTEENDALFKDEENYAFLDCCQAPALVVKKKIYMSYRDTETLYQCTTCQAYWFYKFYERMSFDEPEDATVFYAPLSNEEAEAILGSKNRPDLSYLLTRKCLIKDSQGTRMVGGIPFI